MPVKRRKGSPYWQIKFKLAGRTVRRSSGTADKLEAERLEENLRRALWRQIELGEKHYTWDDAVERCKEEYSHQRAWERTERSIERLSRFLTGSPLAEITRDNILKIRTALTRHTFQRGKNSPPAKLSPATINRDLAELRKILKRCADDWRMLDACPKVPLFRLDKVEPRWITREQAHKLLGKFPEHTRDMMLFALATGLRRSNVTGMEWSRIDMKRRTAFVLSRDAKGKKAIPIPLNSDAIAVLERWKGKHEQYVFCYRKHAPIKQITTKMWRRVVKECGLQGVTFHTMRHSWASWQVQAETPLKMLQELGGWATMEMPLRYAHLNPGHLAKYADRTEIGPAPSAESGTLDEQKKTA